MKPTAAHLALLRQLPQPVLKQLQEHGPGWVWGGNPRRPTPADCWLIRLRATLSTGLWLPTSPTAIGRVAVQLLGERHAVELETTADGVTCATLRLMHTDNTTHYRRSPDAHTAVLRLLIAVCGESPEKE